MVVQPRHPTSTDDFPPRGSACPRTTRNPGPADRSAGGCQGGSSSGARHPQERGGPRWKWPTTTVPGACPGKFLHRPVYHKDGPNIVAETGDTSSVAFSLLFALPLLGAECGHPVPEVPIAVPARLLPRRTSRIRTSPTYHLGPLLPQSPEKRKGGDSLSLWLLARIPPAAFSVPGTHLPHLFIEFVYS